MECPWIVAEPLLDFGVAAATGAIVCQPKIFLFDDRRVATRYDNVARDYLASVCLAVVLVWWA